MAKKSTKQGARKTSEQASAGSNKQVSTTVGKLSQASDKPKTGLSLSIRVLFAALAGIFLIISTSAVWFNRYLFDTQSFTSTATQSLLSDSSRQAMSVEITDRLLSKKPLLKSVLDDRTEKLITALLGSDVTGRIVTKSVTELHTIVTSKEPQSVVIDLSGIKQTLTGVLTALRDITNRPIAVDQNRVNLSDVPDQITLLDASQLPNFYNLGVVMMWLGPLALSAALGLLVYSIYLARQSRPALKKTLALDGFAVVVASFVGWLLGPLFKPTLLSNVTNPNMRVVAENIYNAFIGHFDQITAYIFTLGALLLAVALWMQLTDAWHQRKT